MQKSNNLSVATERLESMEVKSSATVTPPGRRKPSAHWIPKEDDALYDMVKNMGMKKWSEIANELNKKGLNAACKTRTGKQCRSRWLNHLDPNINKNPWTAQEEQTLLKLQGDLGNRWSEISRRMSGRTDNDVKNHYNSLLRKQDRTRRKAMKAKGKHINGMRPDALMGLSTSNAGKTISSTPNPLRDFKVDAPTPQFMYLKKLLGLLSTPTTWETATPAGLIPSPIHVAPKSAGRAVPPKQKASKGRAKRTKQKKAKTRTRKVKGKSTQSKAKGAHISPLVGGGKRSLKKKTSSGSMSSFDGTDLKGRMTQASLMDSAWINDVNAFMNSPMPITPFGAGVQSMSTTAVGSKSFEFSPSHVAASMQRQAQSTRSVGSVKYFTFSPTNAVIGDVQPSPSANGVPLFLPEYPGLHSFGLPSPGQSLSRKSSNDSMIQRGDLKDNSEAVTLKRKLSKGSEMMASPTKKMQREKGKDGNKKPTLGLDMRLVNSPAMPSQYNK